MFEARRYIVYTLCTIETMTTKAVENYWNTRISRALIDDN